MIFNGLVRFFKVSFMKDFTLCIIEWFFAPYQQIVFVKLRRLQRLYNTRIIIRSYMSSCFSTHTCSIAFANAKKTIIPTNLTLNNFYGDNLIFEKLRLTLTLRLFGDDWEEARPNRSLQIAIDKDPILILAECWDLNIAYFSFDEQ